MPTISYSPGAAMLLAALLAGCGGSGAGAPPSAPTPLPPQSMPGDAFTAALVTLVLSAPDSGEPAEVDAAVPALQDNAEPFPVE